MNYFSGIGFETTYIDEAHELIFNHTTIPLVVVYNYKACIYSAIIGNEHGETIIEQNTKRFYTIINMLLNGEPKTHSA